MPRRKKETLTEQQVEGGNGFWSAVANEIKPIASTALDVASFIPATSLPATAIQLLTGLGRRVMVLDERIQQLESQLHQKPKTNTFQGGSKYKMTKDQVMPRIYK